MTNAWEIAEKATVAKPNQGGADGKPIWLRLAADGDTFVIVLLGDPLLVERAFFEGKSQVMTPELRAKGAKASTRVAINVLVSGSEVRVLEMTQALFRDLLQCKAKYGLGWSYQIRRHGHQGDMQTRYSLLPEKQLTTAEMGALNALQLHDLAALYQLPASAPEVPAPRPPTQASSPMSAVAAASSRSAAGRDYVPTCQVGRHKGTPLVELTEKDLTGLARWIEKQIADPNKQDWKQKNEADLAEVMPGMKTLSDEAIASRMADVKWSEQAVANARAKAEQLARQEALLTEQLANRDNLRLMARDIEAKNKQLAKIKLDRQNMMALAEQMEERLRAARPVKTGGQGPKTRAFQRNMLRPEGEEIQNALVK